MINDFDRTLDECIDRIGRGESLEACLTRYPEHAKQLEPLLRAVIQTKAVYSFTPAVDAKREARQRFFSAMEKQSQPTLWHRVFAKRVVWATVVSVLVIAGLFLVLRSTVFRVEPLSITIAEPASESIVDVNTVTIRGNTRADAVVSVNGEPVTVDSSGNFLLPVTLEEGPNVFDIIAADQAGDEATTQLVVSFAP
ncbi:MAG TPA: hypothetical protein VEG28_00465 [Dehalococcoidia bacterium]|nr:hypothetical protein [Dehalococcoidia bacterium]